MQRLNYVILALLMFSLSSCELIGDIFKAGVWAGLLLVAVVIALVIWIISRFRK
jgi:TRAP-type C4-dicarboxylate transport system permease large subunit